MIRGPGGADTETGGAMSQWSVTEIHLPQTLNEEAHADEFSDWEQVSSGATERFAPPVSVSAPPGPLVISRPLPTKKGPAATSHRTFISLFLFLHIHKLRIIRQPNQIHRPNRTIPLFRNNDLRNILILRVLIIIIISIDKHNNVGILLNSP